MTGLSVPEAAAYALAERFGCFAAVTAGAGGVYWVDSEIKHMPAPRIIARDTLAAGDVFHGAFALGLVEGRPIDWIMAFSSMAAAIKCERFGGRLGAPTRAEVLARIG